MSLTPPGQVCGRPAAELDPVVRAIGTRKPFLRCEEDDRGARGLPHRRHFKFSYRSALPGKVDLDVLLDVVEEAREVHTIVTRPIRTSFLEPEREYRVPVPTIESMLGDKLTAFAPHTTGVPFHSPKSGEEQSQQVAKQLFDIGVLFDVATDFDDVAKCYNAVSAQESEYRGNQHSREAALEDTWHACLALTASKKRGLASYPDAPLLHDGLNKMQGHLTWPEFMQGREPRRTLAARAAVLAAHLRSGVAFHFGSMRYTGSSEQIAQLRGATLNGTRHAWIDGLKGTNAEAYYYGHRAIRLSRINAA